MKWFKQLMDIFTSKEEEEQYLQEETNDNEKIQMEQNIERKRSFRFPIIDDNELKLTEQTMESSFKNNNQFQKERISSEIYDVEQSRIHELLEQRRKKKYATNRTYKAKPLKVQEQNINLPEKPKLEKVEINQPTFNRKRFIPTDVPSPVYGFQKPKKKENEMSTEKEREIQPFKKAHHHLLNNEITNYKEEIASSITVQQENVHENFSNASNETYNVAEENDEHVKVVQQLVEFSRQNEEKNGSIVGSNDEFGRNEQDEAEQFHKEDERVLNEHHIVSEKIGEENSNVQLEEAKSEEIRFELNEQHDGKESDTTQNINITNHVTELENNNEENKKNSKGSTLPFNVIMLKSDKEKLAKRNALKASHEQTSPVLPKNEVAKGNDWEVEKTENRYKKPSIQFLTPPEEKIIDKQWMESQGDKLVEALSHFHVSAQVESIMQGPAVTQFEITVAHGIKVSKIRNLADDLKLALAAKDIRIQAPIPGKSTIGIEIPNRISRAVRLSEVVTSESFLQSESPLEAALGLDLTGKPVTIDLRKMPHGLIAGATGSGKSVCINSILVSLLYKANPNELKLMLIDPKMVELAPFNNIPHLVSPVITDVKAATAALKWAVEEMERRYQLFAQSGVRDLPRFNKWALNNGENTLPYILIVIDELADLMMMSPTDVEEAICRIAQKARACGIHLIVATQRPSVDVITGLIKSNIPTRIAFAVSSQVDSRTILDQQGAERLLGRGDMLYLGNGMSAPIRIQGTFVTDDEIETIIDHIKLQGEPNYFFEQEELLKKTEMIEEQDELFEEVCRFVVEQGTASTSSIQRKYHIGYNRAARLMDMLEQQGFISEQRGSKPREVYITHSDLASMFKE